MTGRVLTVAVSGLVQLALVASPCRAAEEAKEQKAEIKLPDAVVKTVQEACPDCKIDDVDEDNSTGVLVYEIEVTKKDGSKDGMDADVAADGTLLSIKTEVERQDLPEAVKSALMREAGGAEIRSLSKRDVYAEVKGGNGTPATVVKLEKPQTIFAAKMKKADAKAKVMIDGDGKVLRAAEWIAKDKDQKAEGQGKPAEASPAAQEPVEN
jgi:uncharacterized membrane protein YkoI